MTEKCSNYNLRYYLFQMGRLKSCTIFNAIFALCGFPMINLANLLIWKSRQTDELASGLLIVGIIGIMGVCIMSYITPIIALKHLFNKNVADNILSLPLKTNRRFLSDVLAILSSFHLPFAISVIITGIIEGCCYSEFGYSEQYFYYSLVGLSLTLVFCAINTAIISCCGRLLEAVIYPIALNIVLPLALVFGMYVSYSNSFGIYDFNGEILQNYLLFLFPFSAVFSRADIIIYNPLSNIFIESAAALVYFALAFLAYKKRRAENIGKSFVFKYSYLLVSTVVSVTFILGYAALSDLRNMNNNYVGMVFVIAIILFILMLIMEVVNYRKVKGILKFILRYAATLCGGLALCYLLFLSRGFGASYYIPAASETELATIYLYYNYTYDVKMPPHQSYAAEFTAVDEEGFELIRKAHKSIIDTYDNELDDINSAYITYEQKNGKATHRNYDNQFVLYDSFWEEVVNSKSYRLGKLSELEKRHGELEYVTSFRLKSFNSDVIYFTESVEEGIGKCGLLDALKTDLLNDEEYGRHDEYPLAALQLGEYQIVTYADNGTTTKEFYSFSQDIAIYESYTNTIELLSRYGNVPTMEEAIADSVNNCDVYTLYKIKNVNTDDPVFELGTIKNAEIIFLTKEEYKELAKYQSEYAYTDEIDHVYKISRGLCLNTDGIENDGDIIPAYKAAGGKDSSIFKSSYVYQLNDSDEYLLNESTYELCEELFANRTALIYNNSIY